MAREITITPDNANAGAMTALRGWIVEALQGGAIHVQLLRPSRSREQEKHYHALIGEIAAQVKVFSKKYKPETWKALLVDQFEKEMAELGRPLRKPSETVPAMDGSGRLVTIRPSTTKFSKEEGGAFIEFLYAQGVEMGVIWSANAEQIKQYEATQR